ncbi:MAG: anti-FecI sigma factor, FecR [Caulobacter sp.]|nr:anti-FecI sigma factor, FecR [Caulobacter sp.]
MTRSQQAIAAAVEWLVRLQRPSVTEADWLAFDAWLAESADHTAAYDAALAFDQEFDLGPTQLAPPPPAPVAVIRPRLRPSRRAWIWSTGAALAAAGVVGAVLLPLTAAPETVYSTGFGERKTVVLEDGSRIDLNAHSKIAVRFARGERHVTLGDAQAFFDVAKDPRRPFVIDAGDTRVRVVGTAFDVRHRDGAVAVAVQRGVVEVRPGTADRPTLIRLLPGEGLSHVEGQAGARPRPVAVDEITSWREGRLIYRDQPLSEIVADLNRQFARPLQLGDAHAADLRLSGVLIVDRQDAMVARLSSLLPVQATTTPDAVVIRSR